MLTRFARPLALLLLAWQALVVQAHGHAPRMALVAVEAGVQAAPSPERPDQPLDCPVCRVAAQHGEFLTPDPVAHPARATADLWRAPASLPAQPADQSSHAWRSRAPPHPLSA